MVSGRTCIIVILEISGHLVLSGMYIKEVLIRYPLHIQWEANTDAIIDTCWSVMSIRIDGSNEFVWKWCVDMSPLIPTQDTSI